MSHKRRTPCCEIEAFRYLNEHDFGGAVPCERREAEIAQLRETLLTEHSARCPGHELAPDAPCSTCRLLAQPEAGG